MRSLAALALIGSACSFAGSAGSGDGEGDGGGADASFACADWGQRRFFRGEAGQCDLPSPVSAPILAGELILLNTDDGTLDPLDGTVNGGSEPIAIGEIAVLEDAIGNQAVAWVISVHRLTVPEGLRLQVVGDNPLLIASWSGLEVAGIIDAGSTFTGDGTAVLGPGARDVGACPELDGVDAANGGGGGGGANNGPPPDGDGQDGQAAAAAAAGGNGEDGQGGDGGNGGSRAAPPTNGLGGRRGGGGGGGSAGIVFAPADLALNGTLISPDPSPL